MYDVSGSRSAAFVLTEVLSKEVFVSPVSWVSHAHRMAALLQKWSRRCAVVMQSFRLSLPPRRLHRPRSAKVLFQFPNCVHLCLIQLPMAVETHCSNLLNGSSCVAQGSVPGPPPKRMRQVSIYRGSSPSGIVHEGVTQLVIMPS